MTPQGRPQPPPWPPNKRPDMTDLKQLIFSKDYDAAWRILLDAARTTADFTAYLNLCKHHRKLSSLAPRAPRKTIRLAVLGGATTDILEAPLSLALESVNLMATIFRADYNSYAEEM